PRGLRLHCRHDGPIRRPGISTNLSHGISALAGPLIPGGGKIHAVRRFAERNLDMAAHVTEIYQPSGSPAPSDPLDVDDSDLASHRLPRLIVGALLGLAALTTLVWFGYERSVGRTGSEMVV